MPRPPSPSILKDRLLERNGSGMKTPKSPMLRRSSIESTPEAIQTSKDQSTERNTREEGWKRRGLTRSRSRRRSKSISSPPTVNELSTNNVPQMANGQGSPTVPKKGRTLRRLSSRHEVLPEKVEKGSNYSVPSSPMVRSSRQNWKLLSHPKPDQKILLELMKECSGSMQGYLRFAHGREGAWYSAYCIIDEKSGSLLFDSQNNQTSRKTLIADLRGCHVQVATSSEDSHGLLTISTATRGIWIQAKPLISEDLLRWLAALLCWKAIEPMGARRKRRTLKESRRRYGAPAVKEYAIMRTGKMLLWTRRNHPFDPLVSSTSLSSRRRGHERLGFSPWRNVSVILAENGELKIYLEEENGLVCRLQLTNLNKCAIQKLDCSVLHEDFCIAIYPQYSIDPDVSVPGLRPIYLSLESRVMFTTWLSLLRTFTVSDLYGPPDLPSDVDDLEHDMDPLLASKVGLFRIDRRLQVRLTEARFHIARPRTTPESSVQTINSLGSERDPFIADYSMEVSLDQQLRARTQTKYNTSNPFWREEYDILDLPAVISDLSIRLHKRRQWRQEHEPDPQPGIYRVDLEGSPTPTEETHGMVEFPAEVFHALQEGKEAEGWWPLVDRDFQTIGEAQISIKVEEIPVLMGGDYRPLSELLHHFQNGLTLQIATFIGSDLRRVAEIFLDIFQASSDSTEWLMALIEDEVDGSQRDTRARQKFNLGNRIGASDSYDSSSEREVVLRGMGKSAMAEASLLFRGNTLLTKALDIHMKRLGKDYLEETLSDTIADIEESGLDCEVDPNRIGDIIDPGQNWRNLIRHTQSVWSAIRKSATKCPTELRFLLRHVRALVEDRYGGFLQSVSYSSVSAFLFLRFFVPAILNPRLFGLLSHHPDPKAQRTLTLVAKTLQVLANMASFGTKEQWMTPMNPFLTVHRADFKAFIDEVCSVSHERASPPLPSAYTTAKTAISRLTPLSREGFPSLPYLIDQPRCFASLVDLWLDSTESRNTTSMDGDLFIFHHLCVGLRQRTRECLECAENAALPSRESAVEWEILLNELDLTNTADLFTTSPTFHMRKGDDSSGDVDDSSAASSVTDVSTVLLSSPAMKEKGFESRTPISPGVRDKEVEALMFSEIDNAESVSAVHHRETVKKKVSHLVVGLRRKGK